MRVYTLVIMIDISLDENAAAVLQEAESRIFNREYSNSELLPYREFGNWLIASRDWPLGVWRTCRRIPGFSPYPPLNTKDWRDILRTRDFRQAGPLLGWHAGKAKKLISQADAIRCTGCLVAFYLQSGVIAKISLSDRAHRRLRREVDNLHWLQRQFNSDSVEIRTPSVIETGNTDTAFFYLQSLIPGNTLSEAWPVRSKLGIKNGKNNLLEKIFLFCGRLHKNNLCYQPRDAVYIDFNAKAWILASHESAHPEIIEKVRDLFEKGKAILEKNNMIPCNFVHGDISYDNILLNGRETWLIDWGNAGVGPIINDWERLFYMAEGNRSLISLAISCWKEMAACSEAGLQEQLVLKNLHNILELLHLNIKREKQNNAYARMLNREQPLIERVESELRRGWNLVNKI